MRISYTTTLPTFEAEDNFVGLDPNDLDQERSAACAIINVSGDRKLLTYIEACLLKTLVDYSPYSLLGSVLFDITQFNYPSASTAESGRSNLLGRFVGDVGADVGGGFSQIYTYSGFKGRELGYSWQNPKVSKTFNLADLPDKTYLDLMYKEIIPRNEFAMGVFRPVLRRGRKEAVLNKMDYFYLNILSAAAKMNEGGMMARENIVAMLYPDENPEDRYLLNASAVHITKLRQAIEPLGLKIKTKRKNMFADPSGYRLTV